MFSLVVAIDCDNCHHAFSRAKVMSLRFPPEVWQAAIDEMKAEAKFQGWYFNDNCSICEQCVEEEKYHARKMQGEYDF